jgi:hypothetical protein
MYLGTIINLWRAFYYLSAIFISEGLKTSYHIISLCRNPVLLEVWSPLQATVHLCGIFCLP